MALPLGDLESTWTPPIELPELHGPQVWDLETWDPFLRTLGPGWAFTDRKKYGHVAGFAVAADNVPGGLYAPIRHAAGGNLPEDQVIRWARHQLKKPVPKIFANAGYDVGWLQTEKLDVQPEHVEDIQLQAPLLDEYRFSYSLDEISMDLLSEPKDDAKLNMALLAHGYNYKGAGNKSHIASLHSRYVGHYAETDARLTRSCWLIQRGRIIDEDLTQVYDLERSLVHVLVAMRMQGVRLDLDAVERLMSRWNLEMDEQVARIKVLTGVDVTAWDTMMLERALNDCGIKVPPTREGKPSVTAEWLESFLTTGNDKAIQVTKAISRLRKLDKAVGTFLKNYYLGHAVDGRVHVTFNQLRAERDIDGKSKGTVSGRLSSSDFNAQNLPVRDEEIGPEVRSCLVPEKGERWLAADVSSQEPRLTVHWAVKAGLTSALIARQRYHDDPETDYHQMVANICGIERKIAKPINLGLAYGMGPPKLCRTLGLPTEKKIIFDKRLRQDVEIEVAGPEGRRILEQYHQGVPFVGRLFKKAEARARDQGFVRTLLGRKCRVNDNKWKDASPRKALNKLIQGSAADQTKMMMRRLYYEHRIIPLVTVHDELGFSVTGVRQARKIIHIMETAVELEVPTVVDLKLGPNWGHVKKLARPQRRSTVHL